MANPQKELGHIEIANDITEKLYSSHLSGSELMVILFVIRKTWGWQKKRDRISISQIEINCQLGRTTVCEVLNKLVRKRLLLKEKGGINILQFNKNYDQWKLPSSQIRTRVVVKSVPKVVVKSVHTKDNKDTIINRAEANASLNKNNVDNLVDKSKGLTSIKDILNTGNPGKYTGKARSRIGGARYEWQDRAVRFANKLGIKPDSSWFRLFKIGDRAVLDATLSTVVDAGAADPKLYFYKIYFNKLNKVIPSWLQK